MCTQYGYDVLQTMYVPLGRVRFTAKCYMYKYYDVSYHSLASFKN